MKRIALAVLTLLLVPQAFAGPWIKSLATAQTKAKENKQLIFVDMFADWCSWCHRMEKEVFPSEVFQKATDDMVLLRLNTEDGAEGTKLAQQFNVTSLPTFLVLTPELGVAGVIRGYAPAPDFVKSLGNVETQFGEFNKRVQNEGAIARDYQKRIELAREFTQHFQLTESEARFRKLTAESGVPTLIRDQAYYDLAVSQAMQNKFDESIKTLNAFGKVQKSGETFERSRILLAQLYTQRADLRQAATELRSFKSRFPKSVNMATVEVMLAQIERRLAAVR